ncbi:hypothetical protein C9R18_25280, partial [Salmonella enterica subsp. enterica serovar Enteritidis]|nr:hypothetical protein [Salmonella enterica subsp. enterica serovar Enteritidis]
CMEEVPFALEQIGAKLFERVPTFRRRKFGIRDRWQVESPFSLTFISNVSAKIRRKLCSLVEGNAHSRFPKPANLVRKFAVGAVKFGRCVHGKRAWVVRAETGHDELIRVFDEAGQYDFGVTRARWTQHTTERGKIKGHTLRLGRSIVFDWLSDTFRTLLDFGATCEISLCN